MNIDTPKYSRDEALELLRKYPPPEGSPEEIVKKWEEFAQEIPVGTKVTNIRDPISRAVTLDGRYYNCPTDSYLSVNIKNMFRGTWHVSDIKKVDDAE